MKYTIAIIAVLTGAVSAWAQGSAKESDFYIRSQSENGKFTGYHQILTAPEDGYFPAVYCNRTFWVRSLTVLWTETEADAGRKLVVEQDSSEDRRVFCEDPNRQVTLEDIGVSEAEAIRLRRRGPALRIQPSRMNIISEAFKGYK
jgi:hypothetical protein